VQEHNENFQLECSLGIKGLNVVTIKQAKKNVKWALKSQDWKYIYVLPFKTMAIMAS